MRRPSRYRDLKWIVEARWPHLPYFEQIAAFNAERVALAYARDCFNAAPPIRGQHWAYRVQERTARGFKVLETFGAAPTEQREENDLE